MSPQAVRMLVETDAIPHLIIDIRSAEEAAQAPLPPELKPAAVHLPAAEVEAALAGGGAGWTERLPGTPLPRQEVLLVFVGNTEAAQRRAAAGATAAGFQRQASLAGGLPAWAASAQTQADLHWISRDAAAVLLGSAGPGAPRCADRVEVLDLRRNDERTLYGSIPGTRHLPVDKLPAALALPAPAWQEAYGFPKPGQNDWVILQCRTNRRSAWAAQLAADAGLGRALVLRSGAYGWRLHPAVKAYRSYEAWDAPPEPEPFQVETVNTVAAQEELAQLGFHLL